MSRDAALGVIQGTLDVLVLKALCAATTVVAVDTSADKLEIARKMGADEGLVSGDDAVKRRGDDALVGARPVLDDGHSRSAVEAVTAQSRGEPRQGA